METMKAYVCPQYGPPEVLSLETCKRPVPGDKEVLLKVYATSVTNSDIFIRSSRVDRKLLIPFRIAMGLFGPRRKIIGEVFAGTVEQVGRRAERFKTGDRVYGLTGFSLGAYAEYMTLREKSSKRGCMALMPTNVSFEGATALAYGGLLALQSLKKKTIQKGSKVLLYGSASTTGLFALQYLKHLQAEATAVCSGEKFDFVKSFGADKLLDYTKDESITRLEQYDIIFDCVGKARQSALRTACSAHIKNKDDFISIDDEALLLDEKRLERITDLAAKKIVKPFNDKIYNFSQMVEAHKYVELGHKRGNVAVTVNP